MASFFGAVFLSGFGSALDVYPQPVQLSISRLHPTLSDHQRLASDWNRVGYAMRNALGKEISEQQAQQAATAVGGEAATSSAAR